MAVAKRFAKNSTPGGTVTAEAQSPTTDIKPEVSAPPPPPKATKTPVKAVAKTGSKASSSAADAATAKRLAAASAFVLKKKGIKQELTFKGSKPAVTSGSILIDHMIGGTLAEDGKGPVCPGYPRRAVTELYGPWSSGKTTAALRAVAEVQKLPGGSAMILDFEKALEQRYARSIGVSFDPDKLLYYRPDTMELGWDLINIGLMAGVDVIVVDSVAAMVPAAEMEKGADEAARIGVQAQSLARNLPKVLSALNDPKKATNPLGTALIFTNQVRAKINSTGRGDNETAAGGQALSFYCHLILKFTKIRSENVERKDRMTGKTRKFNYGQHTQVKVVKSRIDGSNGHTADIFIRYNHGIDDIYSLIEAAAANKVVQKNGSIYAYGSHKIQGREKFREMLLSNKALFEEIKVSTLEAIRATDVSTELSEDDMLEQSFEGALGSEVDETEDSTLEESVEGADFTEDDQEGQVEDSASGSES
jgi:recombination protein RecA